MLGYQEDDVAAICLKSSKFRRSQSKQLWKTYKSVAVHPQAAREMFDYMYNHYFDYYGGSA